MFLSSGGGSLQITPGAVHFQIIFRKLPASFFSRSVVWFYMIRCVKAELGRNSASIILQPFWPKFCKEISANSWHDILNAELCRDFAQILPSDFCKYFGRNLRVQNVGCILRWTLRAEFRPKFLQNYACIFVRNLCRIMNAYFRPKSPQSSACRISADTLHAEFWPTSPQNAACRISNEIFP